MRTRRACDDELEDGADSGGAWPSAPFLAAPKGTPEPVLTKLNVALRGGVESEAFRRRMDELASLPATGEELAPSYVSKLVPGQVEKFKGLLGDGK